MDLSIRVRRLKRCDIFEAVHRHDAIIRIRRCDQRRRIAAARCDVMERRPFQESRELIRLGFRADVEDASRVDAYPILPRLHDRRVTASAPSA